MVLKTISKSKSICDPKSKIWVSEIWVQKQIPKLLNLKLKNKRISQICKIWKALDIKENFAVAVSGGPDSLALAFLAKIYSIQKLISSFT